MRRRAPLVGVLALLALAPAARADVIITGGNIEMLSSNRAKTTSTDLAVADDPGFGTPLKVPISGPFTFTHTVHAADTDAGTFGSAHGDSTATGTASLTATSQFAHFTVSASASANGRVQRTPKGVYEGAGDAYMYASVDFTVTAPTPFRITGAKSHGFPFCGGGGDQSYLDRVTSDGQFQPVTSSPLPPGNYETGIPTEACVDVEQQSPFDSGSDSDHATFDVQIGTPPTCPKTPVSSVKVGFVTAEGSFVQRADANGQCTTAFETAQEAWVGGFDLKPAPGSKLVIDPRDTTNPIRNEGAVSWVLGPSTSVTFLPEALEPFVPSFALGVGDTGSLSRILELPLVSAASARATVTWASGGTGAKLDAEVSLEDLSQHLGHAVSTAIGHSVGTLAGKVTVNLANGKPFDLAAASLQIPEFAVELHDSKTTPPLKLGFGGGKFSATSSGGHTDWSGEVTTLFPWETKGGPSQGKITGRLFIHDEALAGLGLGVSGFAAPIGATGWNLTGVNGNLILVPSLSFDIGAELAEKDQLRGVPVLKAALNIKGFQLAATDCSHGVNPFEFTGAFNSPVLELMHIGTFKGQIILCAYPSLSGIGPDFAFEAGASGELTVDIRTAKKIASAKGTATGWFHGTDFNIEGTYTVTLPVIGTFGATGLFSSNGYAFCGTYGGISTGFGTNNWVDPSQDLGSACDLTPFRALPHAPDVATAAAASEPAHVPSGERVFALAVRGGGNRAPRVRVSGPHGERFTTPAGARALRSAGAVIIPIDQLGTTYVYLKHPAAGTWHVQTLPGSPAVRRIDTAHALPRPHVTARIARLRKGRMRLTWRAIAIPGQHIRLLDRTTTSATVIQKATSRSRGTVTFTPADARSRSHVIEADFVQNGLPRASLRVLHFRLQ